jgi:hypothetical protein
MTPPSRHQERRIPAIKIFQTERCTNRARCLSRLARYDAATCRNNRSGMRP